MRGFVRDEFIPLETLDLDAAPAPCAGARATARPAAASLSRCRA